MSRAFVLAACASLSMAACVTSTDPSTTGEPAPTTGDVPSGSGSDTPGTTPAPAGPTIANGWANTPIPFVAAFNDVKVAFSIHQATAIDATIGVSNGLTDAIDDLGPAIQLDANGVLKVADGATFRADSVVNYTTGAVDVEMHIDLEAHRYSVKVNGAQIATNYSFHASQAQLSRIDTLASTATGATLSIADVQVGPAFCSYAGPAWVDLYHPTQRGAYHVRFDAKVPANGDGAVVGLAARDVTSPSDLAASIRFANGSLVARDGASDHADQAIAYTPDTTYTFTLAVDVTAGTYSVAVQPQGEGSTAKQLATGYAFDPAQGAPAPLTQVGASAAAGYVSLCNLTVWDY